MGKFRSNTQTNRQIKIIMNHPAILLEWFIMCVSGMIKSIFDDGDGDDSDDVNDGDG